MAAARFGKACDGTSRNSSLSPRARGLWRRDCSSGALEVLVATLAYLQRAKRKALSMLPVHWGGGCARGSRFSGQHSDNTRGITVFVLLAGSFSSQALVYTLLASLRTASWIISTTLLEWCCRMGGCGLRGERNEQPPGIITSGRN